MSSIKFRKGMLNFQQQFFILGKYVFLNIVCKFVFNVYLLRQKSILNNLIELYNV